MALETYFDNLEPEVSEAEIWRFMPFRHFEDLMGTDELYFNRADLFPQDKNEGIPPDDYIRKVIGLRRFVLEDETKLSDWKGMLAQNREASYVSCWHLHRHETVEMWKGFAQGGVALCSRYDLLKSIMEKMLDRAFFGFDALWRRAAYSDRQGQRPAIYKYQARMLQGRVRGKGGSLVSRSLG